MSALPSPGKGFCSLPRAGYCSVHRKMLMTTGPPVLSGWAYRACLKLVRVQARALAWTDRTAGLAIRWEATGPGGGLFPILDADIKLAPAGEHVTVLTVTGAYRPPLGALGEALDRMILHRVAAATIRGFAARVAARITGEPGAAAAAAPTAPGPHRRQKYRACPRPVRPAALTQRHQAAARSLVNFEEPVLRRRRRTRSRGSRGSSRLAGPAPR